MSQTVSPSTVSLLWPGAGPRPSAVERFARRRLSLSQGSAIACDRPSLAPGPTGPCPDADLADHIRREIEASDFHGEGYRGKLWARLRVAGVRSSPRRVRRVMGEGSTCAPSRRAQPREDAQQNHRHRRGQWEM